jgi:hypothetical protein
VRGHGLCILQAIDSRVGGEVAVAAIARHALRIT